MEFVKGHGTENDFVVLPDGNTAYLAVDESGATEIVERSTDGNLTRVVLLNETGYQTGTQFHPNALRYYVRDDSFTVSDVKLSAGWTSLRSTIVLMNMPSRLSSSGRSRFEIAVLMTLSDSPEYRASNARSAAVSVMNNLARSRCAVDAFGVVA